MAKRKVVMQVELLYDDEISNNPEDMELADIGYEMTEGSMSGVIRIISNKVLSKNKMAKELLKQGSDPSFLNCED